MKKKSTHTKSKTTHGSDVNCIKEFHLFAGIGGGIYGGRLLHHKCVGAVEIMPYARGVLAQRKKDGWMDKSMDIDSHTDITKLNGKEIRGTFDVLCGGFPCQAFSTAAHGMNIAEKNLWDHMFRVVQESEAPIVFGENVVLRAIEKARCDLEGVGYKVERIRLSCEDLGADHRRNRFWLLAIRDDTKGAQAFQSLSSQIARLPMVFLDGCPVLPFFGRRLHRVSACLATTRVRKRGPCPRSRLPVASKSPSSVVRRPYGLLREHDGLGFRSCAEADWPQDDVDAMS